MTFDIHKAGPNNFYTAVAIISVADNDSSPVEGATVYGSWSGATTDTDSGVTNSSGEVSLQSDRVKNPTSGTKFVLTVDNITKEGCGYDPNANLETSESITVK